MRIRNPRDFWAGAIYLVLAIVVLWIGRGYPQGSSARMGPGYFPVALGSILAVFGAVSIGGRSSVMEYPSVRSPGGRWSWFWDRLCCSGSF